MAEDLPPCLLAIVNKGKTMDENIAVLKIEEDVDAVMRALLDELGIDTSASSIPPYTTDRDYVLNHAVAENAGEPAPEWRIPRCNAQSAEHSR